MGEGVRGTMSAVVHDERPTLHLLFDKARHIGIAIARRGRGTCIGIPVDLLQQIARIVGFHQGGHLVGTGHVGIAVSVVAHHADGVLPRASLIVVGIADGLVDEDGGLFHSPRRESPYGHIGLALIGIATERGLLDLFAIIEQAEEVVAHKAVDGTERVVALITEQEIVRVTAAPLRAMHAIIPGPIAKEQEVTGHIGLCRSPVVKHLQIAAIGRGIRRAAGELIIQFVCRNDSYPQTVFLLMERLDALCLSQPFLQGGDDNHHIHCPIGMVILVRNLIHIFRLRQRGRLEIWPCLWFFMPEVKPIEPDVSARGLGNGDGVFCLQTLQGEGPNLLCSLRIGIEGGCGGYGSYHLTIHLHHCLERAVAGKGHRQLARCASSLEGIGLGHSNRIERLVEEVPASMIPGIVVNLV